MTTSFASRWAMGWRARSPTSPPSASSTKPSHQNFTAAISPAVFPQESNRSVRVVQRRAAAGPPGTAAEAANLLDHVDTYLSDLRGYHLRAAQSCAACSAISSLPAGGVVAAVNIIFSEFTAALPALSALVAFLSAICRLTPRPGRAAFEQRRGLCRAAGDSRRRFQRRRLGSRAAAAVWRRQH